MLQLLGTGNWFMRMCSHIAIFIPDIWGNFSYSLFLSVSLPCSCSFSSLAFCPPCVLLLCLLSLSLSFPFPILPLSHPLFRFFPLPSPPALCPFPFLSHFLSFFLTILHIHVKKQNEGYHSIHFFHNSLNILLQTPTNIISWISNSYMAIFKGEGFVGMGGDTCCDIYHS